MENAVGKILICQGTSGLSAGASEVAEAFEVELAEHNLTKQYQIISTGDRGLFRDVLVDIINPQLGRVTYDYITPEKVPQIVEEHIKGGVPVKKFLAGKQYEDFFTGQKRITLRNCGEIDPENIGDYLQNEGYQALRKALTEMTPQQVIDEMKKSGLRGRGGAGFPTGLKWSFCQANASEYKYMVCNADEGDPGAFMDRSVLEGDPQAVLEGMAIGGYAIGANYGYIYCRAEYPLAIQRLEVAIKQATEKGFLGDNIMETGFSFHIAIKKGAGAFVCGEETALLASIEGFRGMPRSRPPFPAQKGLWGYPTTINNVETLATVPQIIFKGGDWYASVGTKTSKGTKVFALAGKVKNTGLVEVPMGTTIRELVFGPGGGMLKKKIPFKAVQMGGPSGGCLPADLLDTPIDYESLGETGAIMGSGGMVVMDQSTCMVDMAKFFTSFTVEESCGKCVPCRIGLNRMLEVLTRITEGKGKEGDIEFLERMATSIKATALCGLGNTAPNPVLTTIRYFRDEYEAHVQEKRCPAHICRDLLRFEVNEERCTKCGRCFKACPAEAVIWEKKTYAAIDKEKCIRCRSCITQCNDMAIE